MESEKTRSSIYFSDARILAEAWGVRLVALLTWLMGAVNLLSAVRPAMMDRLALIRDIVPLEVREGSRLTVALAGFALFLLAGGLWRRKRTAWLLTGLLLVVSVATHLLKGLDVDEAGMATVLVVLLLLLRQSFYAYSDPPSLRQGLAVLASAFAFTLTYGVAGFAITNLRHHQPANFVNAVQHTLVMLFTFYDPAPQPAGGFGRYFAASIYVVGIATLGFALFMLVRPVLLRHPATADERRRAAEIVAAHGRTTTARLALFEDKRYFFSPGGSVVAYAVRGRGALALGEPIGPPEDAARAITAFRAICSRNDWQPSFLYIPEESRALYQAAGFATLCIGHEAIVPLAAFTLDGSQNKAIRNAYHKLVRLGYTTQLYRPPLDEHLLRELRPISDAWLSDRHGGEKHFFVGWFDDAYLASSPVMVVRNPEGQIVAFANLISAYQKRDITIDLMRHQHGIENGCMEFLFVSLMQWARDQGYDTFSLGATTIFGKASQPGDPRITRALRVIAALVNRIYRFQGLHAFKAKFNPRWEARYLAYPGTATLPLILTTLIRVHSGDNFLWLYLRK
ncbi:MAG TPA: phosphatidylglycerol lysyltransferase domain-containing protein [Anaerolineales bacterium]|nr:phosphatidylglycerol lysyltransferase domain-containing protein [Anaerolineales bacterium]